MNGDAPMLKLDENLGFQLLAAAPQPPGGFPLAFPALPTPVFPALVIPVGLYLPFFGVHEVRPF